MEGKYYPGSSYQNLFDYLHEEHGLTLLQGQMDDLINVVHKYHPAGAVWVKALVTLPPTPGEYHSKKHGKRFVMLFAEADRKMPKEYWEGVEWLDESGTPAAGREEDAVEFAEWAGWDWRRVEGKNMWENQKTLEVLTSAKLYEKFKKETGR